MGDQRNSPDEPDATRDAPAAAAAEPALGDDAETSQERLGRPSTALGRLLSHDDIVVWAVGAVLVGVIVVWIVR